MEEAGLLRPAAGAQEGDDADHDDDGAEEQGVEEELCQRKVFTSLSVEGKQQLKGNIPLPTAGILPCLRSVKIASSG